ncbi:uncharacterized protein METZ01_LOCUS447088 [marine metagenome]|uniref:Uncharacterized protein n=1 Tax=marine metagenome TaxID=408172 RepID=A0A382ZFC3_9ZZZZ
MTVLRMSDLPPSNCSMADALEFAATYNAYNQIAAEPETLSAMYHPIREAWNKSARVPEWMGVDLLRGLLFLMYREDHFGYADDSTLRQMHQVIEAIRSKLFEQHEDEMRLKALSEDLD